MTNQSRNNSTRRVGSKSKNTVTSMSKNNDKETVYKKDLIVDRVIKGDYVNVVQLAEEIDTTVKYVNTVCLDAGLEPKRTAGMYRSEVKPDIWVRLDSINDSEYGLGKLPLKEFWLSHRSEGYMQAISQFLITDRNEFLEGEALKKGIEAAVLYIEGLSPEELEALGIDPTWGGVNATFPTQAQMIVSRGLCDLVAHRRAKKGRSKGYDKISPLTRRVMSKSSPQLEMSEVLAAKEGLMMVTPRFRKLASSKGNQGGLAFGEMELLNFAYEACLQQALPTHRGEEEFSRPDTVMARICEAAWDAYNADSTDAEVVYGGRHLRDRNAHIRTIAKKVGDEMVSEGVFNFDRQTEDQVQALIERTKANVASRGRHGEGGFDEVDDAQIEEAVREALAIRSGSVGTRSMDYNDASTETSAGEMLANQVAAEHHAREGDVLAALETNEVADKIIAVLEDIDQGGGQYRERRTNAYKALLYTEAIDGSPAKMREAIKVCRALEGKRDPKFLKRSDDSIQEYLERIIERFSDKIREATLIALS
mgnify:CR=1 FL=1